MRRKFAIALTAALLALVTTRASADAPYTTWTSGPGGYLSMTQDAYSPVAEVDLPVSGPEDMFVTPHGVLYVADTGNGRIVKLVDFQEVASYGEDVLESPTGIFVDGEGVMYIADAKKSTIVILDADGNLVNEFGRPVEPLFGRNREFLPRKIAVDARQNLYIISEGSVNGIVQMNTNGNFIGYFGANTAQMSLKMILQRMFLTQEQLDQFIRNEAASPSNITIDHQAMVYTVTAGTSFEKSIRRFTISGKNILPEIYWSSTAFRDLVVSENGLLLAVAADGVIFEYNLDGTMLFAFGATDTGDQRLGTLTNPVAIERYGDFVYILDKDKNAVVVYLATEFARLVHEGIRLYTEGYYVEAMPYFEQVLDYNGSFIMAYQAIADAHFKQRDYAGALTAYRYAEDRNGYSEAFWELRNEVLQQYLSQALMWLLVLGVAQNVGTRLDRRYDYLDPIRKRIADLKQFRFVDDFLFMFRFIKQPADSFYYIKKDLRGSLKFALLVYAWIVAVRILSLYVTGFVFNPNPVLAYIRVEDEAVYALLLLFIWNAANYLVSTISDGEGRVRDVVIGTAYSLFPYALFALPIALISNVLTLNEVFIYTFSLNVVWAWTGILLFIMVKEVHNYTFSETVRNVLVTFFTMGLFVLTGYILYVLFNQLFDFVSAIFQEVRLRG
ncbi:MAG TPA: YIP1 family protein [Anaerolineales bacterium]|nr:YIP1 family protein [Anaerolineales bacterium]